MTIGMQQIDKIVNLEKINECWVVWHMPNLHLSKIPNEAQTEFSNKNGLRTI